MADDIKYESKTVRTLPHSHEGTVKDWVSQGWEVVSQSRGRLFGEVVLRRPTPKAPNSLRLTLVVVAAIAILGILVATGVIKDEPQGNDTGVPSSSSPIGSAPDTPEGQPSSTQPAVPEPAVMSIENSEELASLLKLTDYCAAAVAQFATKYAGATVTFDGNVGASNPHGTAKTRFDILIGAGDFNVNSAPGPAFQFRDVNFTDLHWTGPSPDAVTVGLNLKITAKVVKYEEATCLFLLEPIETSIR